jgi:hypothetical protein
MSADYIFIKKSDWKMLCEFIYTTPAHKESKRPWFTLYNEVLRIIYGLFEYLVIPVVDW